MFSLQILFYVMCHHGLPKAAVTTELREVCSELLPSQPTQAGLWEHLPCFQASLVAAGEDAPMGGSWSCGSCRQ